VQGLSLSGWWNKFLKDLRLFWDLLLAVVEAGIPRSRHGKIH
jgi:hypothetical protein